MRLRDVVLPIAGMLVLSVTTQGVLAHGPSGTGISPIDGTENAAPADLGYTSEYAAAKEAAFGAGTPVLAGIFVAGAAGAQPDILPPPPGGYPATYSLSSFVIYHQKTKYYCLVATSQSIVHRAFGGYTSPSIAAEQDTIADAMGTTTDGTSNKPALDWTNAQFQSKSSSWRYVAYDSASLAIFTDHAQADVYSSDLPMYVRVQLDSDHYLWSSDTSALHATLVTGWSSSGDHAKSADPWAHSKSDGTCSSSWDGGDASNGCIWGGSSGAYAMSEYYLARDANGNPEWY